MMAACRLVNWPLPSAATTRLTGLTADGIGAVARQPRFRTGKIKTHRPRRIMACVAAFGMQAGPFNFQKKCGGLPTRRYHKPGFVKGLDLLHGRELTSSPRVLASANCAKRKGTGLLVAPSFGIALSLRTQWSGPKCDSSTTIPRPVPGHSVHQRFETFSAVFFGRRKIRTAMFAFFAVHHPEPFAARTGLARRPFLHAQ